MQKPPVFFVPVEQWSSVLSGSSTFARRLALPARILSEADKRGLVVKLRGRKLVETRRLALGAALLCTGHVTTIAPALLL
jgi:hypothetical protein